MGPEVQNKNHPTPWLSKLNLIKPHNQLDSNHHSTSCKPTSDAHQEGVTDHISPQQTRGLGFSSLEDRSPNCLICLVVSLFVHVVTGTWGHSQFMRQLPMQGSGALKQLLSQDLFIFATSIQD